MGIDTLAHPDSPPRRRRDRRLVRGVALALLAVLVGVAGVAGALWVRADVQTAGRVEFVRPLHVPPLLEGDASGARRVLALELRAGTTEFEPGVQSETWGINGSHLGPTLRLTRGKDVRIDVRNALPESTSLHWHGMLLPARMDGGPHQHIEPGSTWSPTWRVDQPAATLWYHAHQHGRTLDQVRRGLAGMVIVEDPASTPARLPSRYGVDDIPLIVQDARLPGGRLSGGSSPLSGVGPLGDTVLINGTRAPYLDVTTERVRLRLLNASAARPYRFTLADQRPMLLVGTDGGLLPAPHRTTSVQLTPGERAEVVVEVRPGERVALRSETPELGTDVFGERFSGGADRLDVLELRAAQRLTAAPPVPARLAELAPAAAPAAGTVTTRPIVLSGRSINDAGFDPGRVDITAPAGATEIWEVRNDGGPHSFHLHGVQFRVLSLGGAPPSPELAGWKDTVYVPPGRTARLLLEIPRFPDPGTPYLFHCHLLDHEDDGMGGQLVVVAPGGSAAPHVHQ